MEKEMKENKEEVKVELTEQEEQAVDASAKRIAWIQKHVKNYYRTLNGDRLSPEELLVLAMDTIMAGYSMVSRFCDMVEQGVEERIGTVGSVRMTIDNLLSKSFLNKEVAEQQVAQMVQHNLEAQKNKLYKAQ